MKCCGKGGEGMSDEVLCGDGVQELIGWVWCEMFRFKGAGWESLTSGLTWLVSTDEEATLKLPGEAGDGGAILNSGKSQNCAILSWFCPISLTTELKLITNWDLPLSLTTNSQIQSPIHNNFWPARYWVCERALCCAQRAGASAQSFINTDIDRRAALSSNDRSPSFMIMYELLSCQFIRRRRKNIHSLLTLSKIVASIAQFWRKIG